MLANYTGNLDMSVNFKSTLAPVSIEAVMIHLSTVSTGANNLTISKYSTASVHNVKLLTQLMTTVGDVVYVPDCPIELTTNEKLRVLWTNDASSYKTWGVQIQYDVR